MPIIKQLPVDLTEEELRARGDELAQKDIELDALETMIKASNADWGEQRKTLKKVILQTANAIEQRKEMRDVECREEADFEANEVRTVRIDSGEVVGVRAMEPSERQSTLAPN
jgi:alpha-L-fucosidase